MCLDGPWVPIQRKTGHRETSCVSLSNVYLEVLFWDFAPKTLVKVRTEMEKRLRLKIFTVIPILDGIEIQKQKIEIK